MLPELRSRVRVVRAKVSSAALLPRQRATCDQADDLVHAVSLETVAAVPGEALLEERGQQVELLQSLSQAVPRPRDAGMPPGKVPEICNRVSGKRADGAGLRIGGCGMDAPAWSRMLSPARAPNTSPSKRELLARRFAPCTPLQAASPAAYSLGSVVAPSNPVRTPPMA